MVLNGFCDRMLSTDFRRVFVKRIIVIILLAISMTVISWADVNINDGERDRIGYLEEISPNMEFDHSDLISQPNISEGEIQNSLTQQDIALSGSIRTGSMHLGGEKKAQEESVKSLKETSPDQAPDESNSGSNETEQITQIVLAENKDFALISGQKITMPKIIIENGRTLVPLHFFREIKQSRVVYNPAEKSVTVAANSKVVRLVAGEQEIRVNGQLKLLDVPMKIHAGRAYVPVRYIAEIFGYHVSFVKNSGAPTMIGICSKEGMLDYNKAIEVFGK